MRPFPTTAAEFMGDFALDLDNRIIDLDAQVARWHANRDEADAIAQDEARAAADAAADAQDEADALADAIDAGDCDADGEPVAYDRYYGGV